MAYKKRTDTMSVGLMATGAGENENTYSMMNDEILQHCIIENG